METINQDLAESNRALTEALRYIADHQLTGDEARQLAINALQVSNTQPRFMVQWEDGDIAEFYDLWDITEANKEGAADLCEWARNAKPGESYMTGGGAAPLVRTWRVS